MPKRNQASFASTVESALRKLTKQGSGGWVEIFRTRSFFDDWEPDNLEAAKREAEQKCREAREIITAVVGSGSVPIGRGSDNDVRWLPAEEAFSWNFGNLQLLLYWEHEDRESPVTVSLYAFDPNDASHRIKASFERNHLAGQTYWNTSEDEKIALLEAAETSPFVRSIVFQFCRCFPRRHLVDAVQRTLHLEYQHETAETMTPELTHCKEVLAEFGDAFPVTPADHERLNAMDDSELVALVDAHDTETGFRTRAVQVLWNRFLEGRQIPELAELLRRNRHREFDKRHLPDVGELIDYASSRER